MSPAAAAAETWSPKVFRAKRARGRAGKKASRPPLVEVPSELVSPIEEVMKALTVAGQQDFKDALHTAVESRNPGDELAFVVSAWLRTRNLMGEDDFRDALQRLPALDKQSEDLTLEELSARIGL